MLDIFSIVAFQLFKPDKFFNQMDVSVRVPEVLRQCCESCFSLGIVVPPPHSLLILWSRGAKGFEIEQKLQAWFFITTLLAQRGEREGRKCHLFLATKTPELGRRGKRANTDLITSLSLKNPPDFSNWLACQMKNCAYKIRRQFPCLGVYLKHSPKQAISLIVKSINLLGWPHRSGYPGALLFQTTFEVVKAASFSVAKLW